MATLTVTPENGVFGTTITLTGTGFAIATAITIKYNAEDYHEFSPTTVPADIVSDGSGDFTATMVTPNRVEDLATISATDLIDTATDTFQLDRKPVYCSVKDIADWLRIDINANSDPSTSMIEETIMENEDDMDTEMLHTFLPERRVTEVFDVNRLWDWGRGLPFYPTHRNLRDFDITKGDKLEIWNSAGWIDQSTMRIFFENIKGVVYVKGYLFTILTKHRFRLTYRYGGNNEMKKVPKDIKRCAILMTSTNVLETDFQMSQIPYGGDGAVDKDKIMDRWERKYKKIIQNRSEITTVW